MKKLWLILGALLHLTLNRSHGAELYHVQNLGSAFGTTNSYAHGINDSADIVGYYKGTNDLFRAFLLQGQDWSDLGIAGTNTYALNLNSSSHVVGYTESTNGSTAFHFQGTTFTDLGPLGGINSYAHGINGLTNIVGYIDTTNGAVAIIRSNGATTNLGSLGGTNSFAFAINPSNLVVGSSLDSSNVIFNAFVWGSTGMTNLNGQISTNSGWFLMEARGINRAGTIVGWGLTNGVEHAFLLEGNSVSQIAIFPGGTNSYALSLNDSNVVVGAATGSNDVLQAFLWQNGNLTNLNDLLPPETGWELVEARGINNSGQIVGWGKINNQEQAFLLSPNQRPTVTLTTPTNNSTETYPSAVNLAATASDSDGTISKVEFFANGVLIGTDTTSPYSASWGCSVGGVYQIVARATDNSNGATDSGVNTLNFHGPPTVIITAPTNGTQFLNVTNIAISVTATNPLSTITNVGIYIDGALSYSNSAAPWEFNWANPPTGSYTLTARAQDSESFYAFSDPVDVSVYTGGGSPPSAPGAPTGLVCESLSPQQVAVRWTNAAAGLQTKIERKNPGESRFYVVGVSQISSASFIDTALSANQTYTYRVRAANAGGFSSYSSEVTVTTDASGDALPFSGLDVWLRADAGVTVSGSSVTEWQDQSGKAFSVTQETSSKQPTFVTNGFQNGPSIRFAAGKLLGHSTSNVLASGSARTFVFVGQADASGSGGTIVTIRRSTPVYWLLFGTFGGYHYTFTDGVNGANNAYGPADLVNRIRVPFIGVQKTGGAGTKITTSLTGTELPVTQAGSYPAETGSSGFTVGGTEVLTGYNWVGDMAEVLVYSRALSSNECDAVSAYLNRRYAIVTQPDAPTGLSAVGFSPTQVTLTWNASTATSIVYRLERKTAAGSFSEIAELPESTTSYFDTGLSPGTQYTYRVRSVSSVSFLPPSPYSSEASALTPSSGNDLPTSNIKFWFRADAGGTRVPGTAAVSSWMDQSGNDNHAIQSTWGKQPLYVTNAVNGRPVLRWDGINDFFDLPNVLSGLTNAEAIIVHKANQAFPSGTMGFWNLGGSSQYTYYPTTSGTIYDDFGSTTVREVGGVSGMDQYHVYNVSSAPGLWSARLNGKLQALSTENTVSFPTMPRLGQGFWYWFGGDIAEVMIFDRTLSEAERDTVGGYLNTRYALVSGAPGTPVLGAVALSTNQISLSWTNAVASGTVGYTIEQKTGAGGEYTEVAFVRDAYSLLITNASANTEYYFRVKARNYAGTSDYSSAIQVVTPSDGKGIPLTNLKLWLRADLGVSRNFGTVMHWRDQVSTNHGQPSQGNWRPQIVDGAVAGKPGLRFDGINDRVNLPSFMNGWTAAEAFVVLKASADMPTGTRGLWQMSGGFGYAQYPTSIGSISDEFFSNGTKSMGDPIQPLDAFHLYNVSSKTGEWAARINGLVHYKTYVNTPSTSSSLNIGYSVGPGVGFEGDMAEVLVFDKVLSHEEREAVGKHLTKKYSLISSVPQIPAGLKASTIAGSQVSLSWTNNLNTASYYVVERKADGESSYAVTATLENATSYIDTNLNSGQTYYYRVKAGNYAGYSSYSSEVEATVLPMGAGIPFESLKVWLKSDAGISPHGNKVLSWMDQIGTNNAEQGTVSFQPSLVQSARNGKPALRFATSYLTLPDFLAGWTEAEVFIFLKAQTNLPSSAIGLWKFNVGDFDSTHPDVNGVVTDYFCTTQYRTFGTPGMRWDKYHFYNVTSASNYWSARYNETPLFTSYDNTFSTITAPRLGKSVFASFDGDIHELFIFNRRLSNEERRAVANYFSTKYRTGDSDDDGLSDDDEDALGTDANSADSNGDGIDDGLSIELEIDPTGLDSDGDGLTNSQELALGTSPLVADTDRDGVDDDEDDFPLDPTRSEAPGDDPNDVTPPTITLELPINAVLLP